MLSPDQKRFYQENGYVLVSGLLGPEEAASLRREAHDLIDRLREAQMNLEATWASARDMDTAAPATQLLHRHNVEFFSAAFLKLLLDDRFTATASDIIGPNVQLHHTKLFIKPPEKGSPFPMHQDYPYFPHRQDSMIAAIFHFDDAPLEKGCLRVIPGSHKRGPIDHETLKGSHYLPFEQYPLESSVPLPARAGDVVFFSYLTIHGSGVNTSNEARTTLLVQMRDPADLPLDEGHPEPGQGLMLRGILPAIVPQRESVPA